MSGTAHRGEADFVFFHKLGGELVEKRKMIETHGSAVVKCALETKDGFPKYARVCAYFGGLLRT